MAMREGQYTRTVYQHIKEKNFARAIELLEPVLQVCFNNWTMLNALDTKVTL